MIFFFQLDCKNRRCVLGKMSVSDDHAPPPYKEDYNIEYKEHNVSVVKNQNDKEECMYKKIIDNQAIQILRSQIKMSYAFNANQIRGISFQCTSKIQKNFVLNTQTGVSTYVGTMPQLFYLQCHLTIRVSNDLPTKKVYIFFNINSINKSTSKTVKMSFPSYCPVKKRDLLMDELILKLYHWVYTQN